jgi:hypothetical protein
MSSKRVIVLVNYYLNMARETTWYFKDFLIG